MELVLKSTEIIEYAKIGHIDGSTYFDGAIPDDFYKKFKPSFYLLKNGEIVENPDYVEPVPDLPTGPSDQDKINAQLMLGQAKQKEEQDGFNAQILLQLAQIKGGNA